MKMRPEQLMGRAIELSRRGFPAPNPHVGCVIAIDGEIVGEGFHDHAGGAHAEVLALAQAGSKAQGADVFVTLEPCNHSGRTPPCVNALIAAGVASVAVSVLDPNPKAAGGLQALQQAGIRVSSGLLENEEAIGERNLSHLDGPRLAVRGRQGGDGSLDGRVALPSGRKPSDRARNLARRPRWIKLNAERFWLVETQLCETIPCSPHERQA